MTEYIGSPAFRRIFRKQLILPAEHGSWAWFIVPLLGGVVVTGQVNFAIVLVFIGGLSAFLMRQPATRWLRIRQGKGRRTDGPLAAGWTVALGITSFLCLAGLLLLGVWPLLWLFPPLLVILGIYLFLALGPGNSVRTLYMELAGAAGLAAAAPAALIAGTGRVDAEAAWLWVLFAAQNVLGAFYVRLRIADTHQRSMKRRPVFLAHLAVLLLLSAATWFSELSWLVLLPFVAFLLRAGWVAVRPRPVTNIKQFGFVEVAVEVTGALFYIFPFV